MSSSGRIRAAGAVQTSPATSPGEVAHVDGRLRRGARTRQSIIEAYIDLIRAGDPHPRVEQIAERAGTGIRTVYNQFRDLEGLRAEVWTRLGDEFAEFGLGEVAPDASFEERLEQLVDTRARFYEALTPFARAAEGLHEYSSELRRQRAELVEGGMRELSLAFGPELAVRTGRDRSLLVSALHLTTSWHAWISLRDELGLDVGEATAAMALAVRALVRS